MKHVTDERTGAVLFWHVGSLDLEVQDRAAELVARSVRMARVQSGLAPQRALPAQLLCGYPPDPAVGSSRVDGEGGCVVCLP